jgi:hypothetical protein
MEYGYDRSDALLLERKDDMRKRGLASRYVSDCIMRKPFKPMRAGAAQS